jgi:hypothetical protein
MAYNVENSMKSFDLKLVRSMNLGLFELTCRPPSISKLFDQPFWLDRSDPHRMASVMQAKMRPLARDYTAASGNWRHDQVERGRVRAKAIHRIVTEGINPEQAVGEAIARIKQILSE